MFCRHEKTSLNFQTSKSRVSFGKFYQIYTECCYCFAVCMCVCAHACVCVHAHVRVCTHVWVRVCVCMCMFVCIIYNNRTFWMFAIQKSLLVLKFHVIWLLYSTINRIFANYCSVLSIIFLYFTVIHFSANTLVERRVVIIEWYAWKYLECQEFGDCLCFIFYPTFYIFLYLFFTLLISAALSDLQGFVSTAAVT